MRIDSYPYDYPIKKIFPNQREVAGTEGGSVHFAEKDGHFHVYFNEGTMADFLDEDEDADDLEKLITVYEFDTEDERREFIRQRDRGWVHLSQELDFVETDYQALLTQLDLFGTVEYNPSELDRFYTTGLSTKWAEQYPFLFDKNDQRKRPRIDADFFSRRWLAAIHLYETLGYYSLIIETGFNKDKRKKKLCQEIVPEEVMQFLYEQQNTERIHWPELLTFAPDQSDYFFCEVIERDHEIRWEQLKFLVLLREISKKRVGYIHLVPKRTKVSRAGNSPLNNHN